MAPRGETMRLEKTGSKKRDDATWDDWLQEERRGRLAPKESDWTTAGVAPRRTDDRERRGQRIDKESKGEIEREVSGGNWKQSTIIVQWKQLDSVPCAYGPNLLIIVLQINFSYSRNFLGVHQHPVHPWFLRAWIMAIVCHITLILVNLASWDLHSLETAFASLWLVFTALGFLNIIH